MNDGYATETFRFYFWAITGVAALLLFYIYLDTALGRKINSGIATAEGELQSVLADRKLIEKTIANTESQLQVKMERCQLVEEKARSLSELEGRSQAAEESIQKETLAMAADFQKVKERMNRFLAHQRNRNLEKFTPKGTKVYDAVTVRKVSIEGLEFAHSAGLQRLKSGELHEGVAKEFHLDLANRFTRLKTEFDEVVATSGGLPVMNPAPSDAKDVSHAEDPPSAPAELPAIGANTQSTSQEVPQSLPETQDVKDNRLRLAKLRATLGHLMRQMQMELDAAEAKDSRLANATSRIVLSTANVNRANARRLSTRIALVESEIAKIEAQLQAPEK